MKREGEAGREGVYAEESGCLSKYLWEKLKKSIRRLNGARRIFYAESKRQHGGFGASVDDHTGRSAPTPPSFRASAKQQYQYHDRK